MSARGRRRPAGPAARRVERALDEVRVDPAGRGVDSAKLEHLAGVCTRGGLGALPADELASAGPRWLEKLKKVDRELRSAENERKLQLNLARGHGSESDSALEKAFATIDGDGGGSVSKHEFVQNFLRNKQVCPFEMPGSGEFERIWGRHAVPQTGCVHFPGFKLAVAECESAALHVRLTPPPPLSPHTTMHHTKPFSAQAALLRVLTAACSAGRVRRVRPRRGRRDWDGRAQGGAAPHGDQHGRADGRAGGLAGVRALPSARCPLHTHTPPRSMADLRPPASCLAAFCCACSAHFLPCSPPGDCCLRMRGAVRSNACSPS